MQDWDVTLSPERKDAMQDEGIGLGPGSMHVFQGTKPGHSLNTSSQLPLGLLATAEYPRATAPYSQLSVSARVSSRRQFSEGQDFLIEGPKIEVYRELPEPCGWIVKFARGRHALSMVEPNHKV
jgi:hypothetical protein